MKHGGKKETPGLALRRRAEKQLTLAKGLPTITGEEPLVLLHELQVHQIELKMQNEELRFAQREANEERCRYQDLFDFAPVGYFTLDDQGTITEANLTGASLLGCERRLLLKAPLFRFLARESREEYETFRRRVFAGSSGERCEVRLGGNARAQWALLEGAAISGIEKDATCRVALIDITERKRFEQELLQARKAAEAASRVKSQFLANMSHELRTPMTGVIGMLDLALGEELSPALRGYLETADVSAHSLLRLLNDILDMSQIEAGKLSLEDEPFILRECVAGVAALLTPEARRKGLDLSLSVGDDLPEIVVGDRVRLQQVLTNLIGNAVKFTQRGHVKAKVTAGGITPAGRRELIFTITDTGIGIPDGKRDLLFQMFSQADDSHTRRYGGAGLGLAISRELAALMGGTISYSSEEGTGSVFTFTVPLGVAGTALKPEPRLPEPAEHSPHLLLVEDDPVPRGVTLLMLRRANFEVDIADNGLQGVEMWERGNYDLVLMDVQMPVMDGFQATRTIREKERLQGGHTPIVAVTAHALVEDEEEYLAAGMDALVAKPIDFKNCIEIIRDLITQKGQRAAR